MSRFWDMLDESVLVQSLITVEAFTVVCYMVLFQNPIPGEFWALVGGIIGFWFGQKGNVTTNRVVEKTLTRMNSRKEQ